MDNIYKPTSLQISAPSSFTIVTWNHDLLFSHRVYLWKTIRIFWRTRRCPAAVEWYWCKSWRVQLLLTSFNCSILNWINIKFLLAAIFWNQSISLLVEKQLFSDAFVDILHIDFYNFPELGLSDNIMVDPEVFLMIF